MNCYHSNLIEDHSTTPREVEAAPQGQLKPAEKRRNLQPEARAHTRLQREIDQRHAAGDLPEPASATLIRWFHEEFYRGAPEPMLIARSNSRELRMTPGQFRIASEEDVAVGRHHPPPPDKVAAFMACRRARRSDAAPIETLQS